MIMCGATVQNSIYDCFVIENKFQGVWEIAAVRGLRKIFPPRLSFTVSINHHNQHKVMFVTGIWFI